jgi:outer membrane receptor protein involved in Fe transport
LFREFRVGNATTLANPALHPETLTGAEAGLDITGESAGARVTFFRSWLAGLITNVTLASTPTLITRQRRNAAAAEARGVETEVWYQVRRWRAEAAALYADSRLPGGPRIPQTPLWQGSARILYRRDGTLASIGLRAYGSQFEDDRNSSLLPGFATLQLVLRQALAHGVSASFEAENLAGRSYYAGFTPSPVLGSPRLWRAGLIWELRL